MKHFLRTRKTNIINADGNPVFLRGVNLGGWLMMEAYFLHAPNRPVQHLKKSFTQCLGQEAWQDFEENFRGNFIRETDIRKIAGLGFNCVRLPFHYRLIERKPFQYDTAGVGILDKVIRWAEKYKIWVILDLHAAPGAQNHDWHSDSCGRADLWTKKENQKRTLELWFFLADRYKNKKCVAGYDLLNEAVLENTELLNNFYKEFIRQIRRVDKQHILFVEGNKWATNLECLDPMDDDNHVLSIHHYEPVEFTFNAVPHLRYPLKAHGRDWDRKVMEAHLSKYQKISRDRSVPIFVGEFGVNARWENSGEEKWLNDTLSCFEAFGFHWTYWTYKAVKNSVFPDGLFSYAENPPWVNRLGPLTGWDTFKFHWTTRKKEMIQSWRTENFLEHTYLLKVLQKYARVHQ